MLYGPLAAIVLGALTENAAKPFYGRYRSVSPRMDEDFKIDNHPVVIGPCGRCNRSLFHIRVNDAVRCGFLFNVGSRLYMFIAERNYMRAAILRSPDDPAVEPLVGILLCEDKNPSPRVAAVKVALVPEKSPWYERHDLEGRISELLVNELPPGVPDGILTGWRSLPPPSD